MFLKYLLIKWSLQMNIFIYKIYIKLMTEQKVQVKYQTMRSKSKREESTSFISADEFVQFVIEKMIKNRRVK